MEMEQELLVQEVAPAVRSTLLLVFCPVPEPLPLMVVVVEMERSVMPEAVVEGIFIFVTRQRRFQRVILIPCSARLAGVWTIPIHSIRQVLPLRVKMVPRSSWIAHLIRSIIQMRIFILLMDIVL